MRRVDLFACLPRRGIARATLCTAALALGCQPCPHPRPCPKTAPTVALDAAAPAPSIATPTPSLTITVFPKPAEAALHMNVVATGAARDLSRWCLHDPQTAWTMIGAVSGTSPIDSPAPEQDVVTFPVPEDGTLRVSYRVAERTTPVGAAPSIEVMPDIFQAVGAAFLLLPCSLDDRVVPVEIRFDLSDVTPHGAKGGATSYGVGDVQRVRTTGRELRTSMFAAGAIGTARFEAEEGHDEAAWFGYTVFDPRPIAADVAALRTAIAKSLGPPSHVAESLLIVADARHVGAYRVHRQGRGVSLHLGTAQPWSGDLRIAVAAAVLHGWIGTQVWIGPTESERQAEGYWFSEGVTRHLARDLLFRFGWLTPMEALEEAQGLVGTATTSPLRSLDNATLAKRPDDPEVARLLVARGALYAARFDTLLRERTDGKRGLIDVVQELIERARGSKGVLPLESWNDAVRAELGAGELENFQRGVEKGEPVELPGGVLGPCFTRARRVYTRYDLGFDRKASWSETPHRALGVRAHGPADKAGLREADVIVASEIAPGQTEAPVALTVERDGERKQIRYVPRGASISGVGWRRNRVPDAACVGK
jgi:hypothetical protein